MDIPNLMVVAQVKEVKRALHISSYAKGAPHCAAV